MTSSHRVARDEDMEGTVALATTATMKAIKASDMVVGPMAGVMAVDGVQEAGRSPFGHNLNTNRLRRRGIREDIRLLLQIRPRSRPVACTRLP